MNSNPFGGKTRPSLPTLSDIQRRMAELTGAQQLAPQTQLQTHPTPPTPPPPSASPNPILGDAALNGVAGLAVCGLAPHSQAHPAAILLQLLAAFGNAVGPAPHCMVDATRHGLNLFVVLVGESSKARKGTSWNQIRRLFAEVDRPWVAERVTTAGLTPAAPIYALRTAVQRSQCLPEGGNLDAHELSAVAAELRRALDWGGDAHTLRRVRDDQARALWNERYPALSQVRPGLYGAANSRAEAQVLRLSAIYAILDCSPIIRLPHLQAALAKPHSNNSYHWVRSTKAAGRPAAAPLPSGLPYRNRSAWPGKSHMMNRQLRKQPTRSQCRSRLSSLSSLSSHISTGNLEGNAPLKEQPSQDSSQRT